jgi:hypothetical protein
MAYFVYESTSFNKADNSDDTAATAYDLGMVTGVTNWVGQGDEYDFGKFSLPCSAKLSFTVSASDAVKFTVWQEQPNGKLKSLQATTLKAGQTLDTKALLLNAGNYYLSMQSTNAKKGGDADYTVTLNDKSFLFTNGDNSDDTAATAKNFNMMTSEATGWVGMGDEYDFGKFSLECGAKLSFTVSSTDAVKFTVWQEQPNGKLKSLQTTTLKAGQTLDTKALLLNAGNYYLSMQSTNAKKGGNAYYSVSPNGKSFLFTKGDNSDDTAAAAKDLNTMTTEATGWVGLGDEYDFGKFSLESGAKLSFTVSSTDAVKFTVWQKQSNGKLKSLQSTALKAGQQLDTKELLVTAGDYYLSVQSTNAKKGGYADYTVALNEKSRLFPAGDNTNDTWQAAAQKPAKLQGEEITGWVGFGNARDFIRFQLDGDGYIELDLDSVTADAYNAKQIKLTCLDAKGKSVALSALDDDTLVSKKAVATGEYYLGVTCANVKKFDTSYSVTTGLLA